MNGMKFRVWFGKEKRMVYPDDVFKTLIVVAPDGWPREIVNYPKNFKWDLVPSPLLCEVLYCSFYQDVNGKEIYEGDIVKNIFEENDYYWITFDTFSGFYGAQISKPHIITPIHFIAPKVVIVGNIKENYEMFQSLMLKGGGK